MELTLLVLRLGMEFLTQSLRGFSVTVFSVGETDGHLNETICFSLLSRKGNTDIHVPMSGREESGWADEEEMNELIDERMSCKHTSAHKQKSIGGQRRRK